MPKINHKQSNGKIKKTDRKIDKRICGLYEVREEEIKVIENN